MTKKLKVATVFSGIGSIEQALIKKKLRYDLVFACDNGERELHQSYEELMLEYESSTEIDINKFIKDKYDNTKKHNHVKNTYLANYSPKVWYEDIRFIDGTQYKDNIDLFVGGSPCQSFSVYGKRAGLEDTRGTLFYDFARLVNEIQPKVFIFENVPGMVNHDKGNTWKTIQEVFETLNYTIDYRILNSVDYGIPQNRKRLFVVGFKESFYKFNFPQKQKLETSMFDYLEDFVNPQHYLGKKGFEFVTNVETKQRSRSRVNQRIIKTQVANQQFNWIGDFVFEKLEKSKHTEEILDRAYIGEYQNELGVVRQLSYRECLRLMGFSDSFKMTAPNVHAYRQIGNSIVVNVLEAILDSILSTDVYSDSHKVRVGTLFSGIGAAEFAIKHMNIKHDLVFACDNGGREIEYDRDENLFKIKSMCSIEEKKEFVDELYKNKTSKKNYVQQTFMENHEIQHSRYFQDICLLDGRDFHDKVDLLIGGSPCQSFSSVGFKQGLEDARGTLFYEFARLVNEIQPKVFIYENVRGLLTHDKGDTFEVIQGIFNSLGYVYSTTVLNSKDYGLPQNRRRLFVVGFKDQNIKFEFPKPVELNLCMQDFLIDNVEEGGLTFNGVNYTFSNTPGKIDEKYFLSDKLYNYVMSSGTKTFYQKPEIDLTIARTILSTMGNRHRAGIDNYVTTEGRVRMLSEREALRLMGFSDDFKIVVSRAQSYKQSGNSIAVPVLIHIIRSIFETGALAVQND